MDLPQFAINYVFYQEPVINTVMDNSKFIRMIYSNQNMSLNIIFLAINLNGVHIEKYFNKYKYTFKPELNVNEIQQLSRIEKELLEKINIVGKTPLHRISEQIQSGSIKMFVSDSTVNNVNGDTVSNRKTAENQLIIKVSGIWENEFEYGVTYKFIN